MTLPEHSNTTETLWHAAKELFVKWHKTAGRRLRLLGFGVSNLRQEGKGQQLLFSDPKQKALDAVVDQITEKYGSDVIRRSY